MKNTLLLLLVMSIFSFCYGGDKIDFVILSGEIENPNSDSIRSYLMKLSGRNIGKDDKAKDYLLEYVKTIKREVKSHIIKEELLYAVGKWELNQTKKLESVYKEIKLEIRNKEYLITINQKYEKLKKIMPGAVSPTFNIIDVNGDSFSYSIKRRVGLY